MSEQKDEYYINAFRRQDRKALVEVYEKYYSGIDKWICNNGGNKEDAKDIFQETMVTLYKLANKPDYICTNFKALLWGISTKQWLKELRRRKKSLKVDTPADVLEYTDNKNIIEAINEQTKLSLFWEHLARLDEKCRELLGHYFDDLPHERIAEIMGYTYEFARTKRARCKKKLLKSIQQDRLFKELGDS